MQLKGSRKFRVDTYLPTIDSLVTSLVTREKQFEGIFNKFSFLETLHTLNVQDIKSHPVDLANFYSEDRTSTELFMECPHFRSHMLMDIESVKKVNVGDINVGDKTLTTNEEEDCVTINKIYSYWGLV